MSSTYDIPECVIDYIKKRPRLKDEDYYLAGAGRALGWMRIAAAQLARSNDFELKLAEYHAYAGISAARTSIDAFANFLNCFFSIGFSPSPEIDLAKERFRNKIKAAEPRISADVDALARLAIQIDPHRQKVQHREGPALVRYSNEQWYLAPQGLRGSRDADENLVDLLGRWADEIEFLFCNIVGYLSARVHKTG